MKTCSRCKESKNISDFHKRSKSPDGLAPWCKVCFSDYDRERYRDSEEERARKKRNRDRQIASLQKYMFEYLVANPCVDCGNADVRVLEFDHKDGTEKVRHVTDFVRYGLSLPKMVEEIKKCDVRCANCHRVRTSEKFGYWKAKYNGQ